MSDFLNRFLLKFEVIFNLEGSIEDGIWWAEILGGTRWHLVVQKYWVGACPIWLAPPNVSLMGTPCTATL